MGQTQLLLIILGVLLVGIAIYVGVSLFRANTIEDSRNAIITDLQLFASRARAYYWKPLTQGGGNKSFNGITIKMLYPMVENVNARYFVESAHDAECTITGVGKIVTGNGDSVCVKIKVDELRNFIIIVN